MATHSSTIAWKIPWTEEPGRLQSMGSLKVRHLLSDFTFTFHFHALEKEMATRSSVLAWRIPGTGEAWWATVCGVAQSRTRLKRLSSSSSINRRKGFTGGSDGKASACNAGDAGSIPRLERAPGVGNGNPLQCSCLENPTDGGAWRAAVHGVTESWTRLSD